MAARGVLACLCVATSACAFDPHGTGPGGDDDVPAIDAAHVLRPDGDVRFPDAGVPDAGRAPFCDAADANLRGCWRFENLLPGVVVLLDESANGNTGAASAVDTTTGPPGHGDALAFLAASSAAIPESESLDVTGGVSVDMWIHPDTYPPSRAGLLDNNTQYGMFLDDSGGVRCVVGGATVTSSPVPLGVWTHVACTYDLSRLTVYLNGSEDDHVDTQVTIPTASNDGIHLGEDGPGGGDELDGAIDDVRVWSVGLSDAAVCHAADRTFCN